MTRPRSGVGSELLVVILVPVCLAGSLALIMATHRRAARKASVPQEVAVPAPVPIAPPIVHVEPPKPPAATAAASTAGGPDEGDRGEAGPRGTRAEGRGTSRGSAGRGVGGGSSRGDRAVGGLEAPGDGRPRPDQVPGRSRGGPGEGGRRPDIATRCPRPRTGCGQGRAREGPHAIELCHLAAQGAERDVATPDRDRVPRRDGHAPARGPERLAARTLAPLRRPFEPAHLRRRA